jgi:muramoyltetrapeptide carboxypeptidase
VTAAHVALQELCGLITYHTPMPSTEYYKPVDAYTMRYLTAAIAGDPILQLENPPEKPLKVLVPGTAHGQLIGGNLSLLAAGIGTPYEMNTKGKIVFLEDIGEAPYRVDRMLVQLLQAGKLSDAAGILLGAWTDCEPSGEDAITLDEVFAELLQPLGIPVIANVCCGHCLPTMSLPLGREVEISATPQQVTNLAASLYVLC